VAALADQHDDFWATVGVHPDNEGVTEPRVADLIERAAHPKVVGIGETGLDYYQMEQRKGGRSVADMEWQRNRFRVHIRAARQVRRPLIIHTREAADDTIAILREEGEDGALGSVGGVFHCFTETERVARAALDMGFFISFSGILTFKSASSLREVASLVPMDRLLIETDSPYLAPVPHRGEANHPRFLPEVARRVAAERGMAMAEVAALTTANACRLFRIGAAEVPHG